MFEIDEKESNKNVKVDEYGLLQHDKYPFIGASPDGICDKTTLDGNKLTKLVGRLLEIGGNFTRYCDYWFKNAKS